MKMQTPGICLVLQVQYSSLLSITIVLSTHQVYVYIRGTRIHRDNPQSDVVAEIMRQLVSSDGHSIANAWRSAARFQQDTNLTSTFA